MGIHTPLLGVIIDALLFWTITARIVSIRQHQAEVAANLKAMFEGAVMKSGVSDE
jgi:hypothetical protein